MGDGALVKRHAEIVGAGFAGLTAAIALRRRGWTVRVHERGAEIRAFGSALALSENGLKVLEAVGAYDEAVAGAFPLYYRETRDAAGTLISSYDWRTENRQLRMYMLLRSRVIRALQRAAERAGVDIVTGSEVHGVDPGGTISLRDGSSLRGDLVVMADGAGSRARDTLGLIKSHRRYKDGSIRMLLPVRHRHPWPDGVFVEYWGERRRAMLVPCSENDFYLGLIARQDDPAGIAVPADAQSWAATFPMLAPYLADIGEQERWSWDQYRILTLTQWHRGRVAILGDAAHAMSPNFGQGAALAMVNAFGLAAALDAFATVEEALPEWERRERPTTDRTQWLSGLYSSLMGWPGPARSLALKVVGRSKWVMKQRTIAAYRVPTGYDLADGASP